MTTAVAEPATNGTSNGKVEHIGPAPLWPGDFDLGVIGLTGDFGCGKTIFALSICPGPGTMIYDSEDGSETYKSLGFHRTSMSSEMLKKHPKGYKPIDLFNWWLTHVRSIKPGQYRVIVLDTVSEIEAGLSEYVRQNPGQFGYTSGQFAAANAIMQGVIKDYWRSILIDIRARCESFVFTSQLRKVFKGGTPTGKKEPKGKETLFQLASLYLRLERVADSKGVVPEQPAAIVLKQRLSTPTINGNGDVEWKSLLPPRVPVATPATIRKYILAPPDYSKLKPGERITEEKMSEEELIAMRLAAAEAEREAEALRNDRAEKASAMIAARSAQPAISTAAKLAAPAQSPVEQPKQAATSPTESPRTPNAAGVVPVTDTQLSIIRSLKEEMKIDSDSWKKILAKRNVSTARDFTEAQAAEFIDALTKKKMSMVHQQAYDELPKN